jgi:hypothetical protein
MHRLLGALVLAFTCTGLLAPIAARAEIEARGAQRVAIAHMEFEGHVPQAVQELFSERLVEGLSAARFEVLRGRDVEQKLRAAAPDLLACRDAACYPRLAGSLDVGYLITAKVGESNKTYAMAMEIINGRTGAVLAVSSDRCETCGIEEAGEKMGLAASALRERLETVSRAPARFILRSRPAGATVIVDGKAVGMTPVGADLAGGSHHVRLALDGHDPLERNLTVVGGVDETLEFDLVAVPSRFPHRLVGWNALGGGALLAAAGAWLLTVDGNQIRCSAADKDPKGHCPWLHDTKWWGAALLGAGAAAATLGGVFLYLAPRPVRAHVGAVAGVGGTF